jgi:hypothetical protein
MRGKSAFEQIYACFAIKVGIIDMGLELRIRYLWFWWRMNTMDLSQMAAGFQQCFVTSLGVFFLDNVNLKKITNKINGCNDGFFFTIIRLFKFHVC